MDRIAIACALILLGLFVVYVINNNVTKPKPAIENVLNVPSLSPSPPQTQTINPILSPTSSLSSETSKKDNISNIATAVSILDSIYYNFGIVKSGMDVVSKIEIGDKILGITLQ